MKIKTQDLTGPALDWAVAKCDALIGLNQGFTVIDGAPHVIGRQGAKGGLSRAGYSHQWHEGGPIIEREKIRLDQSDHPEMWPWFATKVTGWEKREDEEMGDWPVYAEAGGDTPLVAAMRCYVASKLGAEIDVPDELV